MSSERKKLMTISYSNIDKELAKLYENKVTVNVNNLSKLSAEEILSSMQIIAVNNKALLKIDF